MLGLRSCIFQSDDIEPLAQWYEKVLDKKPYFTAEAYIGFDVWWYELGIFKRDKEYLKPGNMVEIYWWVDDIEIELARLIDLWAIQYEAPVDVGWGIVMAAVKDPFWNIFGIISNPQFQGK